MDLAALFNEIPLVKLLGIEVTVATEGYAEGTLAYSEDILSNPDGDVLHGGATYALADTVGGAAVMSKTHDVAPTVDMRMDYLAPATSDLHCEADVVRHGGSLAMIRADVFDEADTHVATAHGTYKIRGQGEETPWAGDRAETRRQLEDRA